MVLMPLLDVLMPANCGYFFSFLMTIASFDIIPTDDLYASMFKLPESEPINQNFEIIGYESIYFVMNLGSLFIFMSMIPIAAIIALILGICKCSKPCS